MLDILQSLFFLDLYLFIYIIAKKHIIRLHAGKLLRNFLSKPVFAKRSAAKTMDTVIANAKLYENVVINHNPQIDQMKATIPIVKEFIRKRKLIIYGGTAIDYALRLKGDCIYPDETLDVPDLDFYSPQHTEDAYDLADILYQLGYKDTVTFRGFYVLVMKVDIGGINFVADIAYVGENIFEHIPYVEYEGMRVMHPHYQMIDVHSSLSFPFDGAGGVYGEIIFDRWKKDITRYNKLYKHYPIEAPKQNDTLSQSTVAIDAGFGNNVFMGFAAYALLYESAKMLSGVSNTPLPKNIIVAEFKIHKLGVSGGVNAATKEDKSDTTTEPDKSHIHIDVVGGDVHFMHVDANKFMSEYVGDAGVGVVAYKQYKDIIPFRMQATIADQISGDDVTIHVHSTENRLVGIASVKIGPKKLRMVSAQHILMFMLIRYNVLAGKQSSTAAAYYLSTLEIIKFAETAITELSKKAKGDEVESDLILHSPFFPSVNVYGGANFSDAVTHIKHMADEAIDGTPVPPTPARYEPGKKRPRPKFDYAKSKYFDRAGEQVENT